MQREPNTEYVLSLSYGKDSLACLGAIEELGWPLDRITHAEVWATDDIPADLPPMVQFKAKADEIIRERYGIEVEHQCAVRNGEKLTYEKLFYHIPVRKKKTLDRFGEGGVSPIAGFPPRLAPWCNSRLKLRNLQRVPVHGQRMVQETQRRVLSSGSRSSKARGVPATSNAGFSRSSLAQGAGTNIVQYLGIAADEPERIQRHDKPGFKMPLVEIGWTEADCRKWCEERGLLSPIYTTATRGGCWFCHNQGIDQLRILRKEYPDLWKLLMKWDRDSPVSFHADGHTVHDFDLRFQAEDLDLVPKDRKFRWKMLTGDTMVAVTKRNLLKLLEGSI
nr:MAG TPA: phosphoadenosine-phosphosulfate reductase [Caudoviricetes sp.]